MPTQPNVRVPIGATMALRQKLVLMGALMITMFLTALDQSIVATAVPHILAELGGFALFSWVLTLYLLSSTVTIPIVGKLSDMFGRKTFILVGIVIFVSASAACGAAPSMMFLIGARGVQGIGSGIIIACVFATLGDIFTPLERAKYFAIFSGMFTFAQFAGPAAGGFLTDGPGWRWCFYINLPVGIAALAFIGRRLPAGGGTGGNWRRIDFLGALLLAGTTISFMLAMIWSSGAFGWGAPQTIGLLAVAVLFAGSFLLQEHHHPEPIIPLGLFRNIPFVQGVAIVAIAAAFLGAATQYLPTFVQTSLGQSATASALVITPQSLGGLVTTMIAGQVIARTGRYKPAVILGAGMMLVASFMLHLLHPGEPTFAIAGIMVVFGLGSGMIFPVSQVIVQGSVSQAEQGIAASSRQFFLQMSQVFGVALFGLLLTTTYVSTFRARDTQLHDVLPSATYQQFLDPTLALDAPRYARVTAEVNALPHGDALLSDARKSQKDAVATAMDHIFTVSTFAAVVMLGIAVTLRPIQLRSSFGTESALEPIVDIA